MTKSRWTAVALLSVALVACGDDSEGTGGAGAGGGSTSTGSDSGSTSTSTEASTGTGSDDLCPDGLADTEQASPDFSECPGGADPSGEACCSLDAVYCVNLEVPEGGGNIYTKVLFTCGGEAWGSGVTLDRCSAEDFDDLEALDGSPCTDEAPCDITTSDLDGRVAVCFEGTWYVYGNEG